MTDSQQASNAEIDAARQTLSGLSREEIIRRTQESTATGRDNPDHDPYLSGLVNKALNRKTGLDPEFEPLHEQFYGTAPDAGAAAPSFDAPPMQGAKQAPDGNWYVEDPARPGKYLRVVE